jgi:hypothetical protein
MFKLRIERLAVGADGRLYAAVGQQIYERIAFREVMGKRGKKALHPKTVFTG